VSFFLKSLRRTIIAVTMDIVLASGSPRRQELLAKIYPHFRVVPSDVDESSIREDDPEAFVLKAAVAKAKMVGERHPEALVIAADTVVCVENEIFGKPADVSQARHYLERLSGITHRVITGVALFRKSEGRLLAGRETSFVTFRRLDLQTIESYIRTAECLDKAGAYAIQDVRESFVEKLEGDYDNVVGLPVKKVRELLEEFQAKEPSLEIVEQPFPLPWGIGYYDGRPIRVPGAIAGDRVRVRIVKKKPRLGRMTGFDERSPFRVEPECSHFGVCGGCSFQNMTYSRQLELKARYLEDILEEGGIEWPRRSRPPLSLENQASEREWPGKLEPLMPSPDIYGYRNKMEFAFAGCGTDLILGLRARRDAPGRGKKRTALLESCPIFGGAVREIFTVSLEFARQTGLPAYDPLSRRGIFRNLVLREGKNTGELMALLVTVSGTGLDFSSWVEALAKALPRLRSVWHVETDRPADVVTFERKSLLFGAPSIEERLGDTRFRITPASFFQTNSRAAENLYGLIVRRVREERSPKILGLYCGPGAIEIRCSAAAEEVVGIDSEPENIRVAENNAHLNGIGNCRLVRGLVEEILEPALFKDFDFVIADPPREGLRPGALRRIAETGIPRMIYVSCNPLTLARDLAGLGERGYRLETLQAFDFFPHTPHLECLAVLARSG
jgi:23S rRNA (uracil1939-C5)-methyltransferase